MVAVTPWHAGPSGRERPAYPEYKEQFNEDPARFLFTSDPTDPATLQTAIALIKGIQDPDRLDAWLDVETDLAFGPRQPVLQAINRRRAQLRGEDVPDIEMPTASDDAALSTTPAVSDGGRTLPQGSRWACDDCSFALEYVGQTIDARGHLVSELRCPNPDCATDEVHRS